MSKETPNDVAGHIEALLFYKAAPMSIKNMSEILEIAEEDVHAGIENLEKNLENRGLVLILENGVAELGTAPKESAFIESVRKKELSGELGKAALECLTIVLYRGPVARSDIDYVRGVNSQHILRRLTTRGLIENVEDPENSRRGLYQPTTELLAHLGVKNLSELPEYETVAEKFTEALEQINYDDQEESRSEKENEHENESEKTA